jgi:hypothetical protein
MIRSTPNPVHIVLEFVHVVRTQKLDPSGFGLRMTGAETGFGLTGYMENQIHPQNDKIGSSKVILAY